MFKVWGSKMLEKRQETPVGGPRIKTEINAQVKTATA
jgi:hypothetical protein